VRHMGTVLLELELEPREPDQTAGTSMRLAAIAPSAGIYTPVADASLIGEPAAARGRSATEGGDEPGRREASVILSRSSLAYRSDRRRATLQRPLRTRGNARGAWQRKVAMSAAV
jgi:hypothetical protein